MSIKYMHVRQTVVVSAGAVGVDASIAGCILDELPVCSLVLS